MLYGEEAVEGLRWKTSIARFSQNNAQIGIKAAGACPQSKLGPIKPPLPKVIITFCGRKRRISERPALSEAKAALSEFGERAVGAYKPCPGAGAFWKHPAQRGGAWTKSCGYAPLLAALSADLRRQWAGAPISAYSEIY